MHAKKTAAFFTAAAVVLGCVLSAGCISLSVSDIISELPVDEESFMNGDFISGEDFSWADFTWDDEDVVYVDGGLTEDYDSSASLTLSDGTELNLYVNGVDPAIGYWTSTGNTAGEDGVLQLEYGCGAWFTPKNSYTSTTYLWGKRDDGSYCLFKEETEEITGFTLDTDAGTITDEFGNIYVKQTGTA
ncbi:MAG TPA: hypothetical protein O0X97_06010 [Methanocorpusculum sp.]|nr:hypothetical protein [Methanocorpusculum sp.]